MPDPVVGHVLSEVRVLIGLRPDLTQAKLRPEIDMQFTTVGRLEAALLISKYLMNMCQWA